MLGRGTAHNNGKEPSPPTADESTNQDTSPRISAQIQLSPTEYLSIIFRISSERTIVSQFSSYFLSRRRIRWSSSLGEGGPRCPNSPSTDPRMIAEDFRDFSRSYKIDLTKVVATAAAVLAK